MNAGYGSCGCSVQPEQSTSCDVGQLWSGARAGAEGKHMAISMIYLGAVPLCPRGQHLRVLAARCTQLSIIIGAEKTKHTGLCQSFFYLWGQALQTLVLPGPQPQSGQLPACS